MNEAPPVKRPPLLVHLLFHPDSHGARALAVAVHDELNADPVTPGLRVPTTFCPTASGSARLDLAQAERNLVVVLADHDLNNDDRWCSFVVDAWQACLEEARRRFFPVQLSAGSYPLDQRLRHLSFAKAHLAEQEQVVALVTRFVVIAACRLLGDLPEAGHPSTDPGGAATTIFLSHTKLDLDAEPRVVRALMRALGPDQQNETWFDSGDIDAGEPFKREIYTGVGASSFLCVLTDHYASREWCRREVLVAKELQRPIVVVDCLTSHEVRSFPYMGNVPVVRWNGDPQVPIDRLLKETLRHVHGSALLEQEDLDAAVKFSRPPELLTVAGLPADTTVLYPDPPLGSEESAAIASIGVLATTPIMRMSQHAHLVGKRIALSMSESTDLAAHGFDEVHFRGAMLEVSRYLLIRGATLVYGGHLGPAGYTTALIELVRAHNELDGVEPVARLQNLLSWPMPDDKETRSAHKWVAEIQRIPRPDGIDEYLHPDFVERPIPFTFETSPLHRYAWARAMTNMREVSTSDPQIVARIVIGGKYGPTIVGGGHEQWSVSPFPGVLEEVLLSADAGQPVFLVGGFGGVARLVFDVIDGVDRHELAWEFQRRAPHSDSLRELYEHRGGWVDHASLPDTLRRHGLRGLNRLLTERDHRELATTRDVNRIVELILVGLSNL